MTKDQIETWKKTSEEIEAILRELAEEYVKINDLSYLNISFDIDVAGLHILVKDTFRGEVDHVGSFSVEETDLMCPAGLINKWRLNKSATRPTSVTFTIDKG